jgi:hypothetical protein
MMYQMKITSSVALCAASVFFVGGILMATDDCQVPNPSTKYCIDKDEILGEGGFETADCTGYDNLASLCILAYPAIERNQFPDGHASSTSGTTKEEEHDCYRVKLCDYDYDTDKCTAVEDFTAYTKEDKTVVGTAICPTTEE